jgi:hypothetical protein
VTSNASTEHTDKVKQPRTACYLNLAAAQLKEGKNLEKAVKYCTEVLQLEPGMFVSQKLLSDSLFLFENPALNC